MDLSAFTDRADKAERRFLAAAAAAGGVTERFELPRLRGPYDEALALTLGYWGNPDARRVSVIVSGMHGIEGHAGSAIQIASLHAGLTNQIQNSEALLMIHLVNPWGCAWSRRENEDNVDIFRNLAYPEPPYPENPLYDEFEEGINPRAWEGEDRAKADAIYARFVEEHGLDTVIATIRRGQHKHPKGNTYNGSGATWSRTLIEGIGRRWLKPGQRVDVLDVHTGFGAFGEGIIIPTAPPASEKHMRAARMFPHGLYEWGVEALIPSHPRAPFEIWEPRTGAGTVMHAGLEFGTYDVGEKFDLFRASTFIHTYGDPASELGMAVTGAYRELFYPAAEAWKSAVLDAGKERVRQLVSFSDP